MSDWWAPALEVELSQGDLIERVTFGSPKQPGVSVAQSTGKGNVQVWTQQPTWKQDDNGTLCIARGKVSMGVVVSHNCQISKGEKRVLVAPVHNFDNVKPATKPKILNQIVYSCLPLPGIPGHGDMYADLRLATSVLREDLDQLKRIASMTREARRRLKMQLFAFLVQDEEGDPAFKKRDGAVPVSEVFEEQRRVVHVAGPSTPQPTVEIRASGAADPPS